MSQAGESHDRDAAAAQAALQQMTNGYWVTQILYVAAKLGIADLLKDGARSLQVLAESSGAHAPSDASPGQSRCVQRERPGTMKRLPSGAVS